MSQRSQPPPELVVDLTQDDDDAIESTAVPSGGGTSTAPSTLTSTAAHALAQETFSRKRSRSSSGTPPQHRALRHSGSSHDDAVVISDSSDDDNALDNEVPSSGSKASPPCPEPWELVLAHVPGVSVFEKLVLHSGAIADAPRASLARASDAPSPAQSPSNTGVRLGSSSSSFARASSWPSPSGLTEASPQQSARPLASAFVPATTGSSSPFFRGPSQAVLQRQHRIAAAGLQILRLPAVDVIHDNGSIFDAFVVQRPGLTADNIHDCLMEIRSDAKVSIAAHPGIFAYRLQAPAGQTRPVEHSDDNGEDYAGRKILDVLRTFRCEDCLVVVVRWFGGKLLGPRRFTHITNVTRRVLERHGVIPSTSGGGALA